MTHTMYKQVQTEAAPQGQNPPTPNLHSITEHSDQERPHPDSTANGPNRSASHKRLTYLTTKELSKLIKYNARTIREQLKDSVLIEGRHYFHPFGGRKILYIWETIEADMFVQSADTDCIPMANGGSCYV